ncbi:MAG: hypothetical protein F2772_11245 [Actinobacteria bacterium]|uniref:Unannotated protein n=1 Tax=freshwater metagenome TaxID=449393 RepID=A0A6J7C3S3_9ZZZZ|nr:hypothetical protein [Actinomycetota bacterium]
MVKHVKSSEKKLGKSGKEAENIAWATANKRGMLDNKNKKKGVAEGSTTRGGFGGSASQAQHEIQWLKNKIETLKPLLAKRPSVARQIKDLERQIRERELAIAYQKEGVAEGSAPWAANWKKAALASKKAQQSPSGTNHKRAAELHRHGATDPWGPYKDKHIEAAEKHEKAMKMYEGVAEGREDWDTNSTEWQRKEQGIADQGKRDFKRGEHEQEYARDQEIERANKAREEGKWYIRADGKVVRTDDGQPKEFFGKKNANTAGVAYQRENPKAKVMLSTSPEDKNDELYETTKGNTLSFSTRGISEGQIYSYFKKKYSLYESEKFPQRMVSSIKHLDETDNHNEISQFIHRVETFNHSGKVKVGDFFAVLDFEVNFAWKEIEGRGFTKAKRISKISSTGDKINYVEFEDGDRYPRLAKATYSAGDKQRPMEYAAYFTKTNNAEQALTMLALIVPESWEFNIGEIERVGKVAEAQIKEDDVVLAPGKGRQFKPGLLNKPEVKTNPTDTVKLDVPLLIRLLEFAKEDALDDMALHDLAEKLVAGCQRGRTLSMKDYDSLVPEKSVDEDATDPQDRMAIVKAGMAKAFAAKSGPELDEGGMTPEPQQDRMETVKAGMRKAHAAKSQPQPTMDEGGIADPEASRMETVRAGMRKAHADKSTEMDEGRFVSRNGQPTDKLGNMLPQKVVPLKAPAGPRRDSNGLTRDDYQVVWRKIEDVVGQIFPDGDPIDYMAPWLMKKGIQDFHIGEVIDKACKLNGYKDMYAYYDHFKIGDYGWEEPVDEDLRVAPRQPVPQDWKARKQAVQQQLIDPKLSKDPHTRAAFFRKMADLNAEGMKYGVQEEFEPKLVSGPGERT